MKQKQVSPVPREGNCNSPQLPRRQLRVAIGNRKGGVGKSTIAVVLATLFAVRLGMRVLLVDVDPDSDVALMLGLDPMAPGTRELLLGETVKPLRTACPNLHILPAGANLDGADVKALEADDLREALAPTEGHYDVVVIDSAPGEAELRRMVLRAADVAVIPVVAHPVSIFRMSQVLGEIDHYRERGKHCPSRIVIALNQIDGRRKLDRFLTEELKEGLQQHHQRVIHTCSGIVQATANGQLVTSFPEAMRSKAMKDFEALASWILAGEGERRESQAHISEGA